MKRYTLKEAAEAWGVKETTLRQRLFQDKKRGRNLHGAYKHGGLWIVTKKYMDNRNWRNQHETNA